MAILRMFKGCRADNPQETNLKSRLRAAGFRCAGVLIEDVLRVEFKGSLVLAAPMKMQQLFCGVGETCSLLTRLSPNDGPIREISYKRGWTDPELPTALRAFEVLGLSDVLWVRTSKRVQFFGLTESEADQAVIEHLDFNPQVQTLLADEWDTLVPQGEAGGVEEFDIQNFRLPQLEGLLTSRRMHVPTYQIAALRAVFSGLQRPARDGELEMIAAAWSDHCAHTTLRGMGLLKSIQQATERINHPLVRSAFVDNAGAMKFYGDWALCFKGETHISPVFGADPFGGEGTKHGGVIRDVIFFALGAYPTAGSTIVATTDPAISRAEVPAGAFHPQTVVRETIRATADYCNPMGIPMAYARYLKYPRNWKGFSLGHSIGIIPDDKATKGVPKPADYVVLIGGPTGLDGIHGATASSGKMTHETKVLDAAHVQIGAPIEERKFMEAVPKLRDFGCIRASTDCGAAGLASACGEMGAETGIWLNLACVQRKSAGMKRWQILLSESQERGVLAVPPDKLTAAIEILSSYNVPYQIIGVFTNSHRCTIVYDPALDPLDPESPTSTTHITEFVVDLPYSVLTADCPLPHIEVKERTDKPSAFILDLPKDQAGWIDLCKRVLGHYNTSDQSYLGHRFDQTVQGRTVIPYMGGADENMPDDLYVSTPVRGQLWAQGFAVATNQYYGEIDPAIQGRLMYAQAVTKLVAAGFSPEEMVSCVNVYTPSVLDSPENAWALKQLIEEGYELASEVLGIPVITGKDSSSGTFVTQDGQRIDAPLTVCVATLGRLEDSRRLIRKPFVSSGDQIVLYTPGLNNIQLGGSILYDTFGQRGNKLPSLDLSGLRDGLRGYHRFCGIQSIRSRSVVAEGGLLRNLFESCLGTGLGCSIKLSQNPLSWLFGELHGSILFTTQTDQYRGLGSDATLLGTVTDQPSIEVSGPDCNFSVDLSVLMESWNRTFNEVV